MGSSTDQELVQEISEALEDQLTKGTLDLPLLPEVAAEVLNLTNDENSDTASLSALIHRDQSMAVHILRIANSPAYMPVTPITSLQEAVARLGMHTISEIAFATSVKAKVFKVPGFENEVKKIWSHSIASAVWAKEISRMRRKNVESSFLCGLLHQIGKPVVLQSIRELTGSQNRSLKWDDVEVLIDRYFVTAGQMLAEQWKLPEPVLSAIAFYQHYLDAPMFPDSAMMTYFAGLLADYLLEPDRVNAEAVRGDNVITELNLYPDQIDELLDKSDIVNNAVEAMGI